VVGSNVTSDYQRAVRQKMHIRLELPRARLRRWHRWLVEHLGNDNANRVSVVFTDVEPPTPTALSLLLTLEALTQSNAAQSGTAEITPEDLLTGAARQSQSDYDVIVRIGAGATSHQSGRKTTRHVTLLFDGDSHEDALWLALLDKRAPKIGLEICTGDDQIESGSNLTAYPGLEAPHMLSHSADAVFSRAIELIVASVADLAGGTRVLSTSPNLPSSRPPSNLSHPTTPGRFGRGAVHVLARRVGDKARTVLQQVTKAAPQWSVAWRSRTPLTPHSATSLDVQDFHGLPDDGARYYADPFGLDKGGLTHVFVEEFPYATQRGLISAFTIDAEGRCSSPRPVLETQYHLSYPQVFEHAGEIFMVPEASASGGLDLYRADDFPTVWTHDTRLIDEPLHDATLHFDGTRWWLFAATQFLKSSSWCALKIFTADALRGPWHAISTSPIKVDARSARPAGGVIVQNGALWRPAQNCATGYGHALTWCRIDRLVPDSYAEQAVGSMQFTGGDACLGPHTWTATKSIEAIDLFAAPRARPTAGRMMPQRL